ncbi:MAG: protein phosphatase 2C domain-containing protein [Cyanobacterium sp. T60_A2020_053]|nr:protein phosphatase 2C domain-containing protein [Cyanobacterium sp. T60_A2020_053]
MKKWKAIAHCAIGSAHHHTQQPCQDYSNFALLTSDVIVGAVADGAGSALHSAEGAGVAVETALSYFRKLCQQKGLNGNSHPPKLPQAKDHFINLLNEILINIDKKAEDLNCSDQDLACTLMVFVATPQWLLAMQIGDGFMVYKTSDGDLNLIFDADKGEYINETTFVTSSNAVAEMQVKILETKPYFLCASTDGLEKVAIQYKNKQPFLPFFNPLEEYLRETTETDQDNYIQDFLNSERLNARTTDDKTLLLALLEEE